MTPAARLVVVGDGAAGSSAVATLRRAGFDGEITVVAEEPHGTYSRPALSKGLLTGHQEAASVALAGPAFGAQVRSGRRAVALDPDARRLRLDDGEQLPFDGLVVATGSRARRLDDGFAEVTLRSLDDATVLRDRIAAARAVVVIGGGYLGNEVASAARDAGCEVTVVDVRPPLVAGLGDWLASRFTTAAVARGVRLVHSPHGVRRLAADVVELGDGARLEADLVVTAIGDVPDVGWLGAAGLTVDGGLVVDAWCRAAPGIVAAGDVAVQSVPGRAARRFPFWENAVSQAETAVEALLRGPQASPYRPQHYYWTQAYGVSVKVAGPLPVVGPPEVLSGSAAEGPGLLRWNSDQGTTVAALDHRIAAPRLRALAYGRPAA